MKQIRLVPALELGNKVNIDVMDFPESGSTEQDRDPESGSTERPAGRMRKRCGITLEYAPRDIRELRDRGLDRDGMLEYYHQRIYDLVKVNLSQDWEPCGGMDEVMDIVARHLD